MRNLAKLVACLLVVTASTVAAWSVVHAGAVAAAVETAAPASEAAGTCGESVSDLAGRDALFTPAGKGKPTPSACCDPALEPGVGGNPFCFEGHTCCSDGVWRCNNPDATPSCTAGSVCPAGCGSRGTACTSDDDCCATCGKNGRCR